MNEINTCVISLEQWDYFNKLDSIHTASKKGKVFVVEAFHIDYQDRLLILNPDEAILSMTKCIEDSSKKIDKLEQALEEKEREIDRLKGNTHSIAWPTRKIKKKWYEFW